MTRYFYPLIASTGLALVVTSMLVAHQAGCATDVKGGTWGDLNQALEPERKALLLLVAGTAVIGGSLIFSLKQRNGILRP